MMKKEIDMSNYTTESKGCVMQKMTIKNPFAADGEKTQAVLTIPYKGYEISFTTLGNPEIAVFKENEIVYVTEDTTYNGILEAMRVIDDIEFFS
jgi:hypothetical protein